MTALLLFLTLSIAFSFLCSVLEAVLLSIPPSYIKRQQRQNPKLYQDLNQFKEDIDRPLSAILTLNTIAHTVGAIGVGAEAANVFGETKWELLGLSITAESLIAALMTLAILILSEIIPKTLGANNWQKLTPSAVTVLKVLIKILGPLVWLSQFITRRMKKNKEQSVLSRADLVAMTRAVSEDGVLNQSESKVIHNVLNLPKITIEEVMTPRKVMFTVLNRYSMKEVAEMERFDQFSRIPVFDEAKENILGMVLKQDVLQALVDGKENESVETLMRPLEEVREDEPVSTFFKQKKKNRQHLYVVVDGYDSVTGLVTLEDVMETILGYEILDETDEVADLQSLIRKKSGADEN
ncbi:MAG: hemolysin family protein [Vicingaceae bacterium]